MTYALVTDIPVSWDTYEKVAEAALGAGPPVGLVMHVAGPTEEGVRVIDVWRTEEDYTVFEQEKLAPSIATHARPDLGRPVSRDLQVRNLVQGASS